MPDAPPDPSSEKAKARRAEADVKRGELDGQILAHRAKILGRVRKRSKVLFQLLIGAVALGFAASAALSREELRASFFGYHNLCGSIRDGDGLQAVRAIAEERRLYFQRDDDLTQRYDDEIYVLKPEEQWPSLLGCRFKAVAARVYRL